MLQRRPGLTYETLRDAFRWDVPDRLNVGTACLDHPADDLALLDVRDDGVATHTYGDLARDSARLANGLAAIGVGRGDRVGVLLPQSLETALSHLAVYRLGAVALPLTQLFGPDALGYRLADADAAALVTDHTTLALAREVVADLPTRLVVVGGTDRDDEHGFEDLLAAHDDDLVDADTGPDDPALLIYTSGTTGNPKGALHGHRVLYGHLPGFELMFAFLPQPGDRCWTPADWAWIGGLMDVAIPSLFHGITLVATAKRRFDPAWAVELLREQEVTAAFLPPTSLKMMRAAGVRLEGGRLRAVMSGGEPLGAEMLSWAREALGAEVNEIYGQTEANILVGNCASVWDVRPGSMGRPYPGHHVDVLREDGTPAADGELGELCLRVPDPVAMLGYWNRPEATAEKVRDGWLHTGDVGHRDGDGYLWFHARDDDVINSAGYRIGPAEIEECLIAHPAVALAAAIGVPDEVRGEVVKAFVVLADGHEPSEELTASIQDHVRSRLAAYEYPRQVVFLDELPMTTTGKIRRRDLRDLAASP